MSPEDRTPVIFLGFDPEGVVLRLEKMLAEAGHVVQDSRTPGAVAELLNKRPNSTVVVYDDGDSPTAETVLRQVEHTRRRTAVVVLTDHSDFSRYQELKWRGAIGYFEMNESPNVIYNGVVSAARYAGVL